ncbi:MAG: arsenate reductase (glutaredoxin) [Candidatus Azotimanducaceae bacterium]
MEIYHNPNCSKSNRALELLRENNVEPTVIYYLEEPPSPALLRGLLKKLGLTAREILRKKEEAYSLHNLEDSDIDEESILEIMSRNPILIERPIVVADSKAILGRPPENVLELI